MLWLVEFSFLKNYRKTSGVKRLKVSRALLSWSSAAGLEVIDESDWSWCNGGSKGQDCAPVLVRRRTEFITFQIPIYYALCLQQFLCTLLKTKYSNTWQSIFLLLLLMLLHASFVRFSAGGKNGKPIAYSFFPAFCLKQNIEFGYFSHNLIWNFFTFNFQTLFLPWPEYTLWKIFIMLNYFIFIP